MKQPKYSFILHRVRPVVSVMGCALKEGNSKEGNSIEGNSLHRVRLASESCNLKIINSELNR